MSDLSEVKSLIEAQGAAWEEFKKTNDARLVAVEKGQSTADFDAKLAKLESALTQTTNDVKDVALKSQRPIMGDGDKAEARELKSFNATAQALSMQAGRTFQPLDAKAYGEYKSAMETYFRRGEARLTDAERKAINVGTDPQGGYLVGETMEAGIDRVVQRYSVMRQLARVISIGTASYKKLVKTTGTSGATTGGETTAPTQGTSPTWAELEFRTGTYLSDQRITTEAMEDAVQDVETDLTDEIGIEFGEKEGQDFIDGTGVAGPRGMQSYSIVANASYAWGSVGYIASGHASTFATTNPSDYLIDLVHALKRQYRAGAAFSMNDSTLAAIRKFKDGQGNYLWGMTAPSNLMQGAVGTLLGYPVATDDFMPDLGSNTYPVAFGDFKRAYYVIDRKGIAILRDPYTAVPYVKFVARKRVGGGIANFEALKFLKCATS